MSIFVQYYFWLIAVSLFCFCLERISPWRKNQKILRKRFGQDVFWLVFNGHYLGLIFAVVTGSLIAKLNTFLATQGLPAPDSLALLAGAPPWLQFIAFFILKDFIEWNIHRLLHNAPALWQFHKLHHSIEELDWIGNFRFHWGEVVVYKTLSYLPLVVLGIDNSVILAIAVLGTLMQDLNHANLRIDWGPLKYIFNSPMMHVWHHDLEQHGKGGQNFAIVLSVWDWLFKTVYWPSGAEEPDKLGFVDMEVYPRDVPGRFVYPFWKRSART